MLLSELYAVCNVLFWYSFSLLYFVLVLCTLLANLGIYFDVGKVRYKYLDGWTDRHCSWQACKGAAAQLSHSIYFPFQTAASSAQRSSLTGQAFERANYKVNSQLLEFLACPLLVSQQPVVCSRPQAWATQMTKRVWLLSCASCVHVCVWERKRECGREGEEEDVRINFVRVGIFRDSLHILWNCAEGTSSHFSKSLVFPGKSNH